MENKAINQLEELYRDEIDSHDIKKKLNVGITSFKFNDLQFNKKLSSKNMRHSQEKNYFGRNTITYKNKDKKIKINTDLYMPNEQKKNTFYEKIEDSKNEEEEKVNDKKFKKKGNIELKICKTLKNCGENINKAQILLFNKGNNNNNKQGLKPSQKMSTKNILSSTKRGNLLLNSKKHKKIKDKDIEKESPLKNEKIINNELKRKKTYYRSNQNNNKLLNFSKNINSFDIENKNDKENTENNKDSKGKYNNVFNQFRNHLKTNLYNKNMNTNNIKKNKKFNTTRRYKYNNNSVKNKKSYKNTLITPEIIDDSDNEVENNILCLLDKSFEYKRNSNVISKNPRHYESPDILDDKFIKSIHDSLESKNKKIKSNDIGKISNFNSISIIKNEELNHCNINEEDEELLDNVNTKPRFKKSSAPKVVLFELKENESGEKKSDEVNSNKNKKKYIIYNNINYYKTTQKNDNIIENEKKDNSINNKNEAIIYNKANSFNNNISKNCCGSLFSCCFLLE